MLRPRLLCAGRTVKIYNYLQMVFVGYDITRDTQTRKTQGFRVCVTTRAKRVCSVGLQADTVIQAHARLKAGAT